VKISYADAAVAVLLLCLLMLPSPPAPPSDIPPPPPPVEVDTRDALAQANDTVRSGLANLLRVYADEDLTDSKIFGQFSTEFGRVQADAMLPVSRLLVESTDLRATASDLDNNKLGVE